MCELGFGLGYTAKSHERNCSIDFSPPKLRCLAEAVVRLIQSLLKPLVGPERIMAWKKQ